MIYYQLQQHWKMCKVLRSSDLKMRSIAELYFQAKKPLPHSSKIEKKALRFVSQR